MDLPQLLRDFVTLWVVVDPIGTIPVFLAATAGMSVAQRRSVAIRATLYAALILFFFLVLGQFLLEAMGISLVSFRIAGGIVLFLFALTMIFGTPKPVSDLEEMEPDHAQPAVFPIAIPSLASPGAMLAIVLLTDNHRFALDDQAVTAGLLLVVLLVAMGLMFAASYIHKLIGSAGENIISRVMGMILAAVAVDAILSGFVLLGWIDGMIFSPSV